ncbi:glucan biosynthesis protein G [Xenophilus sp. Marseille-Q4582]|uniref:glucan biosynthesis protein G n=1 Tax=Xenophilus sp. Marseille-Q4582 TaxID=2866600 RepID=UPI001CE42658|nr:glucan biosynthesis protein G [Xenophilus sp. Marseille-Q4582]
MTLSAFRRSAAQRLLPQIAAAAACTLLAAQAWAFSLDEVSAKARALADQPYAAPQSNLPPEFSSLQFADYMKIQPRADRFLWSDLQAPFRLSFYHQGMQFNAPVRIHEIVGDQVQELRYEPERFDFGDLRFNRETTSQLGYAGFRVLSPINQPGKWDEVMSLLGASYFRVIGQGQWYGLSARGLAIDTVPPGGEEFPNFREFWVRRPAAQDQELVIYALLDSPRATGAYQFILRPGSDTVVDVQSNLFLRADIARIGIAPLTSMFLYGPNQLSDRRNFRPAIHDSNGLAMLTGAGEWIWRPLNNPHQVQASSFQMENPRGFGLLQRGREFSRYEDLKDRYDLRPSAWIEPHNHWGAGSVELVEIPTIDETNDNIVAYWVPAEPARKGQMLQFAYRMHWTMNEPALHAANNGWVRQTFHTSGERLQRNLVRQLDGSMAWNIDFEGPVLANLPAGTVLQPDVSISANGELLETQLQPNPVIRGWRLLIRARVKDPAQPVELRAALRQPDGRPLTETWSYQLPPNAQQLKVIP